MLTTKISNHTEPRLIDQRKPLRPIRISTPRQPVKVTQPLFPSQMRDARRFHIKTRG